MPTFYNFRENGLVYSFDDIFVPADVFRSGELWVWGSNSFGQIGDNNTTPNRLTPVTTFSGGTNWKQISCGSNNTAAIKTDGTLWVWGSNTSGQLGTNDTTDRLTPVTTFAGGTNWKQVSCGANNTAAIKTDGTLWTWGFNSSGQLGTNDTTNRFTPVQTSAGGTNWKQVSCGVAHVAAIKTDGTLWVWGFNSSGQLGTNDTTNRFTPVQTSAGGTNWKQVACGPDMSASVKTDGTLWTWGFNSSGQLGTNDTTNRFTPVTTFAGGTNWKQVSCGVAHVAAIKTDGTLWVWGSNTSGPLGTNDTTNRLTPVTTFSGGTNWKQVACGPDMSASVKTDGTLWVWGDNKNGRLGNNNSGFVDIYTPITTFAGGTNWKQVSCGDSHTAAVTYTDPTI